MLMLSLMPTVTMKQVTSPSSAHWFWSTLYFILFSSSSFFLLHVSDGPDINCNNTFNRQPSDGPGQYSILTGMHLVSRVAILIYRELKNNIYSQWQLPYDLFFHNTLFLAMLSNMWLIQIISGWTRDDCRVRLTAISPAQSNPFMRTAVCMIVWILILQSIKQSE